MKLRNRNRNRNCNRNSKKRTNSIYNATDNFEYVIISTPKLGILKSLGLVENAHVHKKMTHRMGGPVLIKIGSSKIAIGKDVAEQIIVRR